MKNTTTNEGQNMIHEFLKSLTKIERELVQHHLDGSDAVADCLSQTYDWNYNDIEEVVELLRVGKVDEAIEFDEAITHEVLADCYDGNTMAAGAHDAAIEGEITKARARALVNALESLGEKVESIRQIEKGGTV